MILLDTNVLSALMRETPDPAVVSWLDGQAPESIWTTSVNVFEIVFGLELMDEGRRRRGLMESWESLINDDLGGRVAMFDSASATAAAALAARRRRAGQSVDFRDTQIAGVALSRRAGLATRNTRHFENLDIPVIDPWSPSS